MVMADHLITGISASGEPEIPAIAVEEYLNDAWIESTYPASQTSIKADSDFRVKFNKSIDLDELSIDNFVISRVLSEEPLTVEDVTAPFETLDLVNDYDSISRELILRLNVSLSYLSYYFFKVKDLISSTGEVQVDDHVILFETAIGADALDIDTTFDVDQIVIEDYTLVSPPVPAGQTSTLVACSISDGTIGVASATETITLTFSEDVDESFIRVLEENLSTGDVTVLDIDIDYSGSTYIATITLPNQGTEESPSYVQENCIYTVEAIYTTFEFTGAFDPFYVPLSHFRPYTNAAIGDPITWARLVYEMSSEVYERMGDNAATWESEKEAALRNYTKYLILTLIDGTATNDMFMLGELQITAGLKNDVDYKSLLAMWAKRLFGRSGIRTADPFWPRPNRTKWGWPLTESNMFDRRI